jgi:proteasome accessory factor A
MNRVVGIETEYGCLISSDNVRGNGDAWPTRIRDCIFDELRLGAIDRHYRDYEEPPGNGGFLLNGGRLYIDMGHLEYSSPECRTLQDVVAYDFAGDEILRQAISRLEARDHVSFLRNNIDHCTGATFGCHENYLMKRDAQFTPDILGVLLSFLTTRQIFTGSGRVGQAHALAFDYDFPADEKQVAFQISQRADHIVNDIYQWVQFNRAIINARDEPLADFRKYRRLHLLLGDSNVSPFATALKVGTTSLVLTLLEEGLLPRDVIIGDAVGAMRSISRAASGRGLVELQDGRTRDVLDIQDHFLAFANECLGGRDEETDWILRSWQFTLEALRNCPESLVGGVDWISKKYLLDLFVDSENLNWDDPWLQSLDLEYHNIDREKGLFFGLEPAKTIGEFNQSILRNETARIPPSTTRARGRGIAVERFRDAEHSYLVNWDSIEIDDTRHLAMNDPFETYEDAIAGFLR